MAITIALVSLLSFVVNIPLGMRRERAARFFPEKFLWIHASIPVIIWLRIQLQLQPAWLAITLNIAAAVLGQLVGGALEKKKRQAA